MVFDLGAADAQVATGDRFRLTGSLDWKPPIVAKPAALARASIGNFLPPSLTSATPRVTCRNC